MIQNLSFFKTSGTSLTLVLGYVQRSADSRSTSVPILVIRFALNDGTPGEEPLLSYQRDDC